MRGWVWFLLIGLGAGYLASVLMKGRGFGMVGDILVSVSGAMFGGGLFNVLGLTAYGFTGALIMAVVGAVALLAFISGDGTSLTHRGSSERGQRADEKTGASDGTVVHGMRHRFHAGMRDADDTD